jgi:hypothetical protein
MHDSLVLQHMNSLPTPASITVAAVGTVEVLVPMLVVSVVTLAVVVPALEPAVAVSVVAGVAAVVPLLATLVEALVVAAAAVVAVALVLGLRLDALIAIAGDGVVLTAASGTTSTVSPLHSLTPLSLVYDRPGTVP